MKDLSRQKSINQTLVVISDNVENEDEPEISDGGGLDHVSDSDGNQDYVVDLNRSEGYDDDQESEIEKDGGQIENVDEKREAANHFMETFFNYQMSADLGNRNLGSAKQCNCDASFDYIGCH